MAIRNSGRSRPKPSRSGPLLLEALEDRTLLSNSIPLSPSTWTPIGPAPINGGGVPGAGPVSGRITGIAADPTNAKIIYIASAGGGVWKTIDGGVSWAPLTDSQATLAMGAIAIAPSNPLVIYAGTGEANGLFNTFSNSFGFSVAETIYYGLGVLKSTDGGITWAQEGTTQFFRRSISKIVVDQNNPNIVYVAVGQPGINGLNGNQGIWKSTDGGATWNNITAAAGLTSTEPYSDLIIDPTNSQILYAAIGQQLVDPTTQTVFPDGIYKSIDGGMTWTELTGRLPSGPDVGRISLAISQTNSPQTIYTTIVEGDITSTSYGSLYKLMKSTDGGLTWADLTSNINLNAKLHYLGGQGFYDTTLGVDPSNASVVYVAGQVSPSTNFGGVLESTDGGNTWTDIGIGASGNNGTHADHHAMAFDASGNLLDGDDGGIWRLQNRLPGSQTWADLNGNLNITTFYGVALHPTDPNTAYGGSQDNGTEKFTDALAWNTIRGGDGGFVRVDGGHPNTVYHEFFGISLERSDDGGVTWASKIGGINTGDPSTFIVPYVMDSADSSRLLLGTDRVYETLDHADNWNSVGATVFPAVIDSLAAAPTAPDTIYASAGGLIYVTTDHGVSWTSSNPAPKSGLRFSDIKVDPVNSQIVYVVASNFRSETGGGQVWQSLNGGSTWRDITSNLPDFPVNSILLDPWTKVLYIGNDIGVYASNTYNNASVSWVRLQSGFPHARAEDLELSTVQLQLNARGYILAAGTHGRGLWELDTTHFTATDNVPAGGITAGNSFTLTVNALNTMNQPIVGYTGVYTGTVHFTSSDPQAVLPADYAFTTQDSDTHSFTITLKTAGMQTITISDTANGGAAPVTITVVVNPAATSRLTIQAPPSTTAGVPFSITVTALDQFGNITPGYTGTVTFSTTDTHAGVVLPAPYQFTTGGPSADNGVHTFFNGVTLDTAGTQTIMAQDRVTPSIAGSTPILVIPATASHLGVTAPATSVAGTTFTIAVTALDPFNNIDPTYSGSVMFSTTDKGFFVQVPATYTFTAADAGTHTFANSTSLDTAGNQTITAQDTVTSSINGSATVLVTPGPVTHLGVGAPANAVAFTPFTVTITAEDRFNNTVSTYTDTIHFTTTDTGNGVVLPSDYTFVSNDSGVHAFTNAVTLVTAGNQIITVKDTQFASIKGTATVSVANPVPAITGLNPSSVPENSGGFTLTVTGTGFVSTSKIHWNASTLFTTFVSNTTLSATVPSSFVAEESQPLITVVSPAPGGGTSTPQTFTISDAALTASVSTINRAEGAAFSGQIATFSDANLQAPLLDFTTKSGGATIIWGDGTTATSGSITEPNGVGTAFVVNASHTYAEEGSFTIQVMITDLGGATITSTAAASIADAPLTASANSFVATRGIAFSGQVATFTDANPNAPLTDFTTGSSGASITWGDGTTSAGTVSQPGGVGTPFQVSGSHTYQTPGFFTMTVAVVDLGGSATTASAGVHVSKRYDIVGRDKPSGDIWVGASNGSSFTSAKWANWSPNVTWVDVVSGDFTGDGRADLAGRVLQSGEWWVSVSNGSSFTTTKWTAWSPNVTWVDVRVGNFVGDGKTDIIGRVQETGEWWLAQSNGSSFTSTKWSIWSTAVTWVDVKVGDFNGDGKSDITARVQQDGDWWTGISTGSSLNTTKWGQWSPNVTWADVQVGDFNGDGKSDIAGRVLQSGEWWVGQSTGTSFTTSLWAVWSPAATWVDVKVGDFNGDGKDDIVGRLAQTGQWSVALSTGSSFNSSVWAAWSPAVSWVDVQVGDFNGDGMFDITGRDPGSGQWWTAVSTGKLFNTTMWASWSPAARWVDVHADNYVL
jgi:hypothetical protein